MMSSTQKVRVLDFILTAEGNISDPLVPDGLFICRVPVGWSCASGLGRERVWQGRNRDQRNRSK